MQAQESRAENKVAIDSRLVDDAVENQIPGSLVSRRLVLPFASVIVLRVLSCLPAMSMISYRCGK
jgi:hypothetical protein